MVHVFYITVALISFRNFNKFLINPRLVKSLKRERILATCSTRSVAQEKPLGDFYSFIIPLLKWDWENLTKRQIISYCTVTCFKNWVDTHDQIHQESRPDWSTFVYAKNTVNPDKKSICLSPIRYHFGLSHTLHISEHDSLNKIIFLD